MQAKHRPAESRSLNSLTLWELRFGFSSGFRDKSWSQKLLPCFNIGFSMYLSLIIINMVLMELLCLGKLGLQVIKNLL